MEKLEQLGYEKESIYHHKYSKRTDDGKNDDKQTIEFKNGFVEIRARRNYGQRYTLLTLEEVEAIKDMIIKLNK